MRELEVKIESLKAQDVRGDNPRRTAECAMERHSLHPKQLDPDLPAVVAGMRMAQPPPQT
jgi:hypothetical protein